MRTVAPDRERAQRRYIFKQYDSKQETPVCPYCKAKAILRENSYIYGNANYNRLVWVCRNYPKCDAYGGCHPESTVIMGTLADGALRRLRRQAHAMFDRKWKAEKNKGKARQEAYRWLRQTLHLPTGLAHISMLNHFECQVLIDKLRAE